METLNAISQRRSTRKFMDKKAGKERPHLKPKSGSKNNCCFSYFKKIV